MNWEVGESVTHPGYWSAESVNGEGEISVVLFLCPRSREQAEEFVSWKMADKV